MAVTSEQLFKFVEKSTTVDIKLDKDGEEVFRTEATLFGDSLATALRAVTDLAAHETGIALARHQFDAAHGLGGPDGGGSVLPFPGPRAN